MSLFGFLGKVATGFIAGGPLGAIAGGASHFIKPTSGGTTAQGGTTMALPRVTTTNPISSTQSVLQRAAQSFPVLRANPQINIAKVGPGMPPPPLIPQQPDSTRTSGVQLFPGAFAGTQTQYYSDPKPPQGGARGYHLNKSGYYTKGGNYVAPQSRWVKNRRRNPLNPRALSRSISRISSAKNAAKFLGRVTVRDKAAC